MDKTNQNPAPYHHTITKKTQAGGAALPILLFSGVWVSVTAIAVKSSGFALEPVSMSSELTDISILERFSDAGRDFVSSSFHRPRASPTDGFWEKRTTPQGNR